MTNFNEQLDEIFYQYRDEYSLWQSSPRGSGTNGIKLQAEAKQAITNLIKDLVRECKPPRISPDQPLGLKYQGRNEGVIDFEQNILKALEEK